MDFSKLSLRIFTRNIYTLFAYDVRTLLLEDRERLVIESMYRFYEYGDSEKFHEEMEYVFRHGIIRAWK